jgi:hypothetical protein
MSTQTLARIAPWILTVVAAYALGLWRGSSHADRSASTAPASVADLPSARPRAPDPGASTRASKPLGPVESPRINPKVAEVDALASAACLMSEPDARTYAFFENLEAGDLGPVAAYIEGMPTGNEQDVMFVLLMRRWAQLDGPGAVARAGAFPALATRAKACIAAYEAWADRDAASALASARKESQENTRMYALVAVFRGAAASDPRTALGLLQAMPADFLESHPAEVVIRQLVNAAYGTGKRDTLRMLIDEMPAGGIRSGMIDALAREWGGHHPDEALSWILQAAPPGADRDNAVKTLFGALTRKDPSMAAACAAAYPDAERQPALIAAAVAEWAKWDVSGAEAWMNEQKAGRHLDRATCVMVNQFIGASDLARAFAWARRIDQSEVRGAMLANLGRAWAQEKPAEFKQFIGTTSLQPGELEKLVSRIGPSP